jgi:hypothetical protein
MFTPQTIYCNECGKPYKTDFGGIISRMAHARVCSMACHDLVEKAYVRALPGKPDPADAVEASPAESQGA